MKNLLVCLFVMVFSAGSVQASAQKLCDQMNYVPSNDVAYRPNPNVVSADLNAVPISLGDVEIPLSAYLVEELGLNVPVSAANLGSVVIKENGSVIYNGKDISSNVQTVCNTTNVVTKKPVKPEEVEYKQARQVRVETVKSKPLKPISEQSKDKSIFGGFGQDHTNQTYND